MRTWIKFCGTTSLADAMASIAAGADALGFIFAPSKRQVTAAQVSAITKQLPDEIEKVGVFMDEPVENILSVVEAAGLTGVQLHGQERSGDVARLAEKRGSHKDFRVIRTVLVKDNFRHELQSVMSAVRPPDCVLLDSGAGSGKTFAWAAAKDVAKDVAIEFAGIAATQIIVAGGLTPENVGEAIRTFSPWGVDVVSGVELQAGKKDPQKLKAFVDSVRKAENKNG
jgi:phosphoribosylanthranilate isomerase